jgi:hypothetical protein
MNWLDTPSTECARTASAAFWIGHREALRDGTFWADRIARYRGQPIERLKLAIENFPLPAAFREAAVAIRSLVRSRLRQKQEPTDEVVLLYWLAAIESFGLPFSEHLRQPGFNVLQSIPGQVIKSLPFTYAELGYKELSLLNKTDVKWCVTLWGEPETHTTLNRLHAGVWHEYERLEAARQKRELEELWRRGLTGC